MPVTGPTAPTGAVGLRREDGRWLAIVVAQVAPRDALTTVCPLPSSADVVERGRPGASANDCLRFRRDADYGRWLPDTHPVLVQWLEQRGFDSPPRAWVGHRLADGGRLLDVHALLDSSLIEPDTRSTLDFLAAGRPALDWVQLFAAQTRAAGVSAAQLVVPPFPFAPQIAPPAPPPRVLPRRAPPVLAPPPPRPAPALVPRADRQ